MLSVSGNGVNEGGKASSRFSHEMGQKTAKCSAWNVPIGSSVNWKENSNFLLLNSDFDEVMQPELSTLIE